MFDVSALGFSARVIASRTFPQGFTITEFADDGDPFDSPAVEIATMTMNLNGAGVKSATPTPVKLTLNVIPMSDADQNLSVIFNANRPAAGKLTAGDVITIVAAYPDGRQIVYTRGIMTEGAASAGVASAGRFKSQSYSFVFEQVV